MATATVLEYIHCELSFTTSNNTCSDLKFRLFTCAVNTPSTISTDGTAGVLGDKLTSSLPQSDQSLCRVPSVLIPATLAAYEPLAYTFVDKTALPVTKAGFPAAIKVPSL